MAIRDQKGRHVAEDDFFLLMNTHHEPSEFTLPKDFAGDWKIIVDTARPDLASSEVNVKT